MQRSKQLALAAAGMLAAAGFAAWAIPESDKDLERLGLFSSLPIYWSEAASIGETLDGGGQAHWVRTVLEEKYVLVPLDTLDGEDFKKVDRLIMAQPRVLTPAENVALDGWVRAGGMLLLFADPFLTDHSRFAFGDKRRPQDTVLLSPILRRWKIELTFDDAQAEAERTVAFASVRVPVRLAGTLATTAPTPHAKCELAAEDTAAVCIIGKGRVVIFADAAVLETERLPASGKAPLEALVDRAFDRTG